MLGLGLPNLITLVSKFGLNIQTSIESWVLIEAEIIRRKLNASKGDFVGRLAVAEKRKSGTVDSTEVGCHIPEIFPDILKIKYRGPPEDFCAGGICSGNTRLMIRKR